MRRLVDGPADALAKTVPVKAGGRVLAGRLMGLLYGYEINKNIRQRTNGDYEFKEATLYTAFRRLEQNGAIVSGMPCGAPFFRWGSGTGLPPAQMPRGRWALSRGARCRPQRRTWRGQIHHDEADRPGHGGV